MKTDIYDRSLDGEINREDALMLVKSNPFELFNIADQLRQEIVGDKVTFVANRNIDITDRCIIECGFCSFRNHIGYEMTIDEILSSVQEAKDVGAVEICIFGGVLPHMTVEYYLDILKSIKSNYDIKIHGLSPVEVYHAAKSSEISTKEALSAFKKAGLDTLTGAAAEILVDSVREQICPNKVSTAQWVEIITEAHQLGIPTTSTIMYGTVENWEDRIDHLLILRDIQRQTGGFTEFVPLTFLNENNLLGNASKGANGMDDLKLHALARVVFGRDLPNIQASWIKMGTKMAQVVLCCGANDLGGTMMEDKISVAAGASHGEYLSREEMAQIIKEIGRLPAERDTLYNLIE